MRPVFENPAFSAQFFTTLYSSALLILGNHIKGIVSSLILQSSDLDIKRLCRQHSSLTQHTLQLDLTLTVDNCSLHFELPNYDGLVVTSSSISLALDRHEMTMGRTSHVLQSSISRRRTLQNIIQWNIILQKVAVLLQLADFFRIVFYQPSTVSLQLGPFVILAFRLKF